MSAPLCRRCGKTEALHLSGRSDTRWCAGMIGAEYDPPTPKAKPMKSDLEILRELVTQQIASYTLMAATVRERLPTSANAADEIAAVLGGVLNNIDTLRDGPAPDAGDDHGAALALVQSQRDESNDALARALGECDRLRGVLEKKEYAKATYGEEYRGWRTERDALKRALAETQADADGRFHSQAETIDRVRAERDRYDAECNTLRAALASVEGERDKAWQDNAKLLGGRDRVEAELNSTRESRAKLILSLDEQRTHNRALTASRRGLVDLLERITDKENVSVQVRAAIRKALA